MEMFNHGLISENFQCAGRRILRRVVVALPVYNFAAPRLSAGDDSSACVSGRNSLQEWLFSVPTHSYPGYV